MNITYKRAKIFFVLAIIMVIAASFSACDYQSETITTRHTLTIEIEAGRGEIIDGEGNTILQNEGEVELNIEENTLITFILKPDAGWYFADWKGADLSYEDGEYNLKVNSDEHIKAVFKEKKDVEKAKKLENIVVGYGREFIDLPLPNTVEVILEDNTREFVSADWNEEDYEGTQTGEQVIEGKLVELPKNVDNPEDITANIKVIVSEEKLKPAEFMINSMSTTPEEIIKGENMTAAAQINNAGEESGIKDIQFTVSHEEGEKIITRTQNIFLDSGETKIIEFSEVQIPLDISSGIYTAEISSEDDKTTKKFSLGDAFYEIVAIDIPEVVYLGEMVELKATVKNTGYAEGEKDIIAELFIKEEDKFELFEREILKDVVLEPGESKEYDDEVEIPEGKYWADQEWKLELITEDDIKSQEFKSVE